MNQSTIIKNEIYAYLEKGLTDKQLIFNKVVEDLGVPRPTVRRIARELRKDLVDKIKVLSQEYPRPSISDENCESS